MYSIYYGAFKIVFYLYGRINTIMASRQGSLLEKNVSKLLKLSGLSPELNKIVKGYEIDVYLKFNNIRVAFECKQYERSTLAIRNLIHQWDSKNKELHFDRIVLVLIGCDVSTTDYSLAKKYDILIWDERKLTDLLDKAIDRKSENQSDVLKEMRVPFDQNRLVEVKLPELETEQQIIIKDTLDKFLKKGSRGSGFVIFDVDDTLFYVQYSLEDNGLSMFFSHSKTITKGRLNAIVQLLVDMQFETNNKEDPVDLIVKELMFDNEELYAQCGEDTTFIAILTDKIFREIFNTKPDYCITPEIQYDG